MVSTDLQRVVIVGAGHGGGTAADFLRRHGFDGELVVLGAEPHHPYHRPPLSKALFTSAPAQPLHPAASYADQSIDLRLGVAATRIDATAREVHLAGGDVLSYDALVIATGAVARRLPIDGADLEGVHELRTLSDARRLEAAICPADRLAIVGGGWIGLEVAAAARSAGLAVTVLEREERLLARVASSQLSDHLTEAHCARGTAVLTSAGVAALVARGAGRVGAVRLDDGTELPCDHVLVGVGAVANDALARDAGLACDDGVLVDAQGRTTDPHVYAIGDVTRRPVGLQDGRIRLESIPSALEQARQAVAAMLGLDAPEPEVPWFWSDQFDLKLQIAGLLRGADGVIVRADPDRDSLAIFHTHGDRLLAVEAVNAAGAFMAGKAQIAERCAFDPDRRPEASRPPVAAPPPRAATSSNGGPPVVTYVHADGSETSVEIELGTTLMDGAVGADVPGIVAECGGGCSCGTCHVYVEETMLSRLPEPAELEADMLPFVEGVQANSRLSCQLRMTPALHGLVVRVPGAQA